MSQPNSNINTLSKKASCQCKSSISGIPSVNNEPKTTDRASRLSNDSNDSKDDQLRKLKQEIQQKSRELDEKDEKIKDLNVRLENIRHEWQSQQEHMGRICSESKKVQNTLAQHSIYCASLGAIMGSIIWKMSRLPGAVENMIDGNRTSELLKLMDDSLNAFLEVFHGNIPENNSNEYQFLLSWCGILTNMSASPDGRLYLCTKPEGTTLLSDMVLSLPKLTLPNGELLKRMILMVIHNLLINKIGLKLMHKDLNLMPALAEAMNLPYGNSVLELCLKIIYTLTQEIPSKPYYFHVSEKLPFDKITESTNRSSYELSELSKKILENIESASRIYDLHGHARKGSGIKL